MALASFRDRDDARDREDRRRAVASAERAAQSRGNEGMGIGMETDLGSSSSIERTEEMTS